MQIDAPQYAALLDETIREGYRQRGSDPDKMLDACIELDNAIIAGHPGMTFGIHICRGNHKSMFYASGGYDRIAAQVFQRARFDRFLLEYDDERSGTFEPLRHVPDDRVVVLGLVSSKTPRLESGGELKARIAEAARIVPLERLALSPQCGFASTHEGNALSPDDQRRKLELVSSTAREVWGGSARAPVPACSYSPSATSARSSSRLERRRGKRERRTKNREQRVELRQHRLTAHRPPILDDLVDHERPRRFP